MEPQAHIIFSKHGNYEKIGVIRNQNKLICINVLMCLNNLILKCFVKSVLLQTPWRFLHVASKFHFADLYVLDIVLFWQLPL